MKFFAEPNYYVRINNKYLQRITGKKGLYFDANGEYVTDKPSLINALKTVFRFEDDNLPSEDKTQALNANLEEVEAVEEVKEVETFKCEHCDFETTKKAALIAHNKKHKGGK